MKNKIAILITGFILSLSTISFAASQQVSNIKFEIKDTTVINRLTFTITNNENKQIRLLIKKDNVQKYLAIKNEQFVQRDLVLTEGYGKYDLYVMIKNNDTYGYGPHIQINNVNEIKNFNENEIVNVPAGILTASTGITQIQASLDKITNIDESSIRSLAISLTKNCTTLTQKIEKINEYVVKNIKYDYEKYNKMLVKDYTSAYGADIALNTKKGVCYDQVKLFEALAKEIGIEAIAQSGYTKSVVGYHAWIEVTNENGQNIILDVSADEVKYEKTNIYKGLNIRNNDDYYVTKTL